MEEVQKLKKLEDYPIADSYPFGKELQLDVTDNLKYVRAKSNISISKDMYTMTKRSTYAIKDKKEFIKIYKDSLKTILKLSSTSQKVLWYIMDNLGLKQQCIDIPPRVCMEECSFKTPKSVRDGIMELLDKNILTRTPYMMRYWVNPMVLFNGNRMEFIREYILEENE